MSESLAARVERERIHALYRQGPLASLTALIVGALVLAAMWRSVPQAWLWTWYALIALNQAARIAMVRAFHRENPEGERVRVWAARYTAGMAVGGTLFGSVAVFMLPLATPIGQAFLIGMISGMAAGSVPANASHRPAMLAYLVAILAPMAVSLSVLAFVHGTLEYGLLAVTYLFYVLVLLGFGGNAAELLRKTIEFGHRNVDLVAELREKTKLAEQASLAKSKFFAAASHDLRQPLQALGLFAASLGESKREAGEARRIERILASVGALESLFDELLDISKLDAGYVTPAPAHFEAKTLFDRLETVYEPIARNSGLELSFDGAGTVLHTDPLLLERVLGNLVSNALRYTPAGSVSVRCRRSADRVAIEVADTGVGIPAAERERVFDEFYQLGNPERDRRKGLGLGLATVKRIAQLLQCPISLQSEPGRGSVFAIEVPAGDPARIAPPPAAAGAQDMDVLRGKLIAILDDDREVRDGLAELLGLWQCRVVAAASAQELMERLETVNSPPDVVVADYRLRERETGPEAIAALHARYGFAIPALIISGDTSQEMFAQAKDRRLPLLSKPVRPARLRATLQHLLSSPAPAG